MTKVLNLDDLQSVGDKVLRFKGVDHEYHPLSVGEFIDEMKTAEARDKEGEVPLSEHIEFMVKNIVRSFPTVNAEDLKALPLDKLKLITDFVAGVTEEEAKAAVPAELKNETGESN